MYFKKKKIAFILNKPSNYVDAQPANRLRAFDIIKRLNKFRYKAELYNPEKKYDIVIINRIFNDNLPDLVKELKHKGTIVGLDEVVNYINIEGNKTSYVNDYVSIAQVQRMKNVLNEVDFVIVPSHNLQTEYMKYHSSVFCIEDMVYNSILEKHKKHNGTEGLNLMYCGASQKAVELLPLKKVLQRLHEKFGIQMLYITEKDPELDIIPYKFIKYDQQNIASQLLEGDIKLAPRNLSNAYNLGHSSLKIAYPMAVGIPAVCSQVPSYFNRGALFAKDEEEWENILISLITNPEMRNYYGNKARKEVAKALNEKKITDDYHSLFKHLVKNKF